MSTIVFFEFNNDLMEFNFNADFIINSSISKQGCHI
jgi:hypothetical protein